MSSTRDDFPEPIKHLLAECAGYVCSNPDCGVSTVGPSINPMEKTYIGEAAHIFSAAANGPRANPSLTPEERRHYNNGIHLCSKCATIIDKNNGRGYPAELLIEWKKNAEKVAKARIYKKPASNVFRKLGFSSLEDKYSAALTCMGLNERHVNSCPANEPYIKEVTKFLSLANSCVIIGESGSGKSLLTYQVAYQFHTQGWDVLKLTKGNINDNLRIDSGFTHKSVIVIDDAQTLPIPQLEDILNIANCKIMVLVNWNSTVTPDFSFIRKYPNIEIAPNRQVSVLREYCLINKSEIADILRKVGVEVSNRTYYTKIDFLIDKASKERTPWLFNYVLTNGWKTAHHDMALLESKQDLDVVMAVVAIYQFITLDRGIDIGTIIERLLKYKNDNLWIDKAKAVISKYCLKYDGAIRHKHYEYARIVFQYFVSKDRKDETKVYFINFFKDILSDNRYRSGHSNLLELLAFKDKYSQHFIVQSGFTHDLATKVFNDKLNSNADNINLINSLVRFDEDVLRVIENNNDKVVTWLMRADRKTAGSLGNLLNTLHNTNYKGMICGQDIVDSILLKLFASNISEAFLYAKLLNRLHLFLPISGKSETKGKIEKSGWTLDVSQYKYGENYYYFSQVVSELFYISEKWTSECINLNMDTISGYINVDPVGAYQFMDDIFMRCFGVLDMIFGTKRKMNLMDKSAKTLSSKIKPESIVKAFRNVTEAEVQTYTDILLFFIIHNKKSLKKIRDGFGYQHLKKVYSNHHKLDHNHANLLRCLYSKGCKRFHDYMSYIIVKYKELSDPMLFFEPNLTIEQLKSGKKFSLKSPSGALNYKIIHTFLLALNRDGERDLVKRICYENKKSIQGIIFTSSINVDNDKDKLDFLKYLYKSIPDLIKSIFKNSQDIPKLIKKIRRLLKGKKVEKRTAALYLFFIKHFADYSDEVREIERKYPSSTKVDL